ncbi:MAG: hypothetical protein DRJ35_06760 [Thermoprotei archaeon]|nr:MAG: hypothetical protein DRJ35_06760 [Thermoprotei archaeon]
MKEKYVGKIIFSFEDPSISRILYQALYPETVKVPSHRSQYEISLKDNILIITIFSKDLSSFRAATNTMLRLLRALEPLLKC